MPAPVTARSDADRLSDLARQFRDFLTHQTNVELLDIGAVSSGLDALRSALERLDAALDQLADLTTVYADTMTGSLEPLVYPVAALTGEYVRHTLGGQWQSQDDDIPPGHESLKMTLDDGDTIDLISIVRVAILSGPPNLTAMIRT